MEFSEAVSVNSSDSSTEMMVASNNFSEENIDENSIGTLQNNYTLYSYSEEDNNLSQVMDNEQAEYGDSVCEETDDFPSDCNVKDSTCIKIEDEYQPVSAEGNGQDTYSLASSYSSMSSSSSLSSMMTYDSDSKNVIQPAERKVVKCFGPANESQDNESRNAAPVHPRIRRVPSTANPKYKTPNISRNHRSKSQPHIQVNQLMQQRRNSSPSSVNAVIPNVHIKQPLPNLNQPTMQQKDSQQQQIIYLQIPQPSQAQLGDPQALQQQISSQLQLLVPQIFNQLVNQINVSSNPLNTVKVSLNQTGKPNSENYAGKDPNIDNNAFLTSQFTQDSNLSQRMLNQMLQQNTMTNNMQKPQQKRPKQKQQKAQGFDNTSDYDNNNRSAQLNLINQVLQKIPPQYLQKNYSKSETTYIEIQQLPGYPKLTIPLTQELILKCQELNQLKDPGLDPRPYRPRLDTIIEESLSVKRLKLNASKFSKTKIVACILTILLVFVVIFMSGDKTIAIAVVAAIFILCILGAMFYLYWNSSSRGGIGDNMAGSTLQVDTISDFSRGSLA